MTTATLAFFSVIGKYIAKSGGILLLKQSRILKKGHSKESKGESYNRCRRIHQIIAGAMKTFHIREFDSRLTMKEEKKMDFNFFSKECNKVIDGYLLFWVDTLESKHRLTAQCWMGYMEMLHLYHEFPETEYLDLYILCLAKTTNQLFVIDHLNYTRSLVLFYDNFTETKNHPPRNI